MLSAAILSGGRARRFDGHDKSALVVGGQTILERQVFVLSQLTSDILLVGAHHVQTPAVNVAVRRISDRIPDCGPLGGLDAALAECGSETLIVLACDMPFVTAPLLADMAARAERQPGVQAVVPRTKRGYHPLCAVYTRGCRPLISRHLADKRLKLVELIERLERSDHGSVLPVTEPELEVFGDPARLLANVNTPGEYEELEALSDHRP